MRSEQTRMDKVAVEYWASKRILRRKVISLTTPRAVAGNKMHT